MVLTKVLPERPWLADVRQLASILRSYSPEVCVLDKLQVKYQDNRFLNCKFHKYV